VLVYFDRKEKEQFFNNQPGGEHDPYLISTAKETEGGKA
jgi:hypothetical protein